MMRVEIHGMGRPLLAGPGMLVACSSKGEIVADESESALGLAPLRRRRTSAEVAFDKAFAYDQGGTMLAYLSSSPTATCTNVTDYLRVNQIPTTPSTAEPGTRNLLLKIERVPGGFSHNQPAGDPANLATLGSAINCAMGEGALIPSHSPRPTSPTTTGLADGGKAGPLPTTTICRAAVAKTMCSTSR